MDRNTDNQIERHKISDRQPDGYRKIERTSQLKPINIFQPNSLSLLLLLLLFSSSSFTSSSSPFYFTKGELKKILDSFQGFFLREINEIHSNERMTGNRFATTINALWRIQEHGKLEKNIHEGREKVENSLTE